METGKSFAVNVLACAYAHLAYTDKQNHTTLPTSRGKTNTILDLLQDIKKYDIDLPLSLSGPV